MQVKERLQQLAVQRGGMMEQWEEGWEYLQLSQSFFFVLFLMLSSQGHISVFLVSCFNFSFSFSLVH